MKTIPPVLYLPIATGALFTAMFLASWAAYAWGDGDGDGERAGFCTAVEVLAGPLLAGGIQAVRVRPSCLPLLRVGSVLFIAAPPIMLLLWRLDRVPQYIDYAAGRFGDHGR